MDFSSALKAVKAGLRAARAGWNGKGMWIELVTGDQWKQGVGIAYEPLPFIAMKTADNGFVPWLASQTDLLADDWEVV